MVISFIAFMFFFRSIYFIDNGYKYVFEFDSIDEGFRYQILYIPESEEYFTNENSVFYDSMGNGIDSKHHTIEIPVNEQIKSLRLDFGDLPLTVKIKNVQLKGKDNFNIDNDQIVQGLNEYFESYDNSGEYLELVTSGYDSFSLINDINCVPQKNININYYKLIMLAIIICIVLNLMLYIFGILYKQIGAIKSIFTLIVLVMIVSPVFFMSTEKVDLVENRTLATFPKIYVDESLNTGFIREFENWFNDRFGFRQSYIKIDTFIGRVFQPNRIQTDQAMLGKDEWLFYIGLNSIANYQGINLYSDEELETIKQILIERNTWFENQGIEYYILIPPDKHRLYGEYYPDYIKKVSDNSRLKQLKEALKDTDVKIIDPYEKLAEKKSQDLLYYKGDNHWNELGAFYGFEVMMDQIEKDFNSLNPPTIDDFNIEYNGGDVNGQGVMLKYDRKQAVMYPTLTPKYQRIYETSLNDQTGEGIKTNSTVNDLKVIMCRDSFATAMLPYISDTFGSVEYLWYRHVNDEQNRIIQEKPDIVIEEYVERNIGSFNYNSPALQEVK